MSERKSQRNAVSVKKATSPQQLFCVHRGVKCFVLGNVISFFHKDKEYKKAYVSFNKNKVKHLVRARRDFMITVNALLDNKD